MRKLRGKFHFVLRFCTRKRSETYIIGNMRTFVEDMNQEQVATVTPLNQQQSGRSTEYTININRGGFYETKEKQAILK